MRSPTRVEASFINTKARDFFILCESFSFKSLIVVSSVLILEIVIKGFLIFEKRPKRSNALDSFISFC